MISLCKQFLLAFLVLLAGCTMRNVGENVVSPAPLPEYSASDIPINVFSTYSSELAAKQCQRYVGENSACKNDGISASLFLNAIEELVLFSELSPSVSRHDYELLIANQTVESQHNSPKNARLATLSLTEFSIEWRGILIDNQIVEFQHQGDITPLDVKHILVKWWLDIQSRKVLSAPYLYQALAASNYLEELELPLYLNQFQLAQRHLYPDPFKGIIARYIHPEFTDAIFDISIYPILAAIDTPVKEQLADELNSALEQAKKVAQSRNMQMTVDQHNVPFMVGNANMSGLMVEISASGEYNDALYASIYVFRLQDKIVKFSTTFPSSIGDPLVEAALPLLQVPVESALMKQLRSAL